MVVYFGPPIYEKTYVPAVTWTCSVLRQPEHTATGRYMAVFLVLFLELPGPPKHRKWLPLSHNQETWIILWGSLEVQVD